MRRFGFVLLTMFSLVVVGFSGVLTYFAIRSAIEGAAWGAWVGAIAFLLLAATFAWVMAGASPGMTAPPGWQYELPIGVKVLGGLAALACVIVAVAIAVGAGGGILP